MDDTKNALGEEGLQLRRQDTGDRYRVNEERSSTRTYMRDSHYTLQSPSCLYSSQTVILTLHKTHELWT